MAKSRVAIRRRVQGVEVPHWVGVVDGTDVITFISKTDARANRLPHVQGLSPEDFARLSEAIMGRKDVPEETPPDIKRRADDFLEGLPHHRTYQG